MNILTDIVTYFNAHSGAIQAITTIALAIFTLLYVFLTHQMAAAALAQAAAAKRAAQATVWIEAQRVFTSKEFSVDADTSDTFGKLRGSVMKLERPIETWNSAPSSDGVTKEVALNVCRGMCEVADLVEFAGLELEIVLRAWGDPFRKTWVVLAPLVREEQELRSWPFLWARFEAIGETALRWLGWPRDWERPSEPVLMRVGWDWELIKRKAAFAPTCPRVAVMPHALEPTHWNEIVKGEPIAEQE